MAKSDGILGISVRHNKLSLSMMRGGSIQKTAWCEIPDNIVDDYKILSENLFSEFLKEKMGEYGFKAKKAAFVVADSDIFIRSFSMPKMDDDQLRLNIPFEFRDYISGELSEFVFDFVKRKVEKSKDDASETITLLAFAIPIEYINKLKETLRLAGLKLERAVPETTVYETILTRIKGEDEGTKERCFLDIGNNHISMRVFKNGIYKLSHILDVGERHIVQAIADDLNVDMHLATTYLRTNYQDCHNCMGAVNAYKDISLEVMKGLNYYDMADMSSRLKDVVLCGSGAMIKPFTDLLKERIDKTVVTMQELFPSYKEDMDLNVTFCSVGVLRSVEAGVGLSDEVTSATEKKKIDWKVAIASTVLIIIAALLIAKFAILDRYNELTEAQAYEAMLQTQVDADIAFINETGELSEEYYHYTWDDMTEEELGRVSRVDVAKLADFMLTQGVTVTSLKLTGTTLVAGVTGDSLDTMSKLTAALAEQEVVASCSLANAEKIYNEEDTVIPEGESTGASEEATAEEENTEEETTEETEETVEEDSVSAALKNSDYIVNAEINIYLATLNAGNEEGEE